MKILIIDGYVDEPTCLGVPPSIATYPRYIAGAAKLAGSDAELATIEQLREREYKIDGYDTAFIVSGNPVPGKYLGGIPIRGDEFDLIARANRKLTFHVGGPIRFEQAAFHSPNLNLVRGDIERYAFDLLSGSPSQNSCRSIADLDAFAEAGAFIVQSYPRFPDVIVELETGRGCPRKAHCTFCIEGNYPVEFRSPEAIEAEVAELYRVGIRHFRLGKQADLFSYGTKMETWRDGFPKPEPEKVKKLYSLIRSAAPDLSTLHLDNVNPGTLARFPEETALIAAIVAEANTAGDVAAFGMESADPEVIRRNALKATQEQVMTAIEIINAAGGKRENGVPKLLPGINLIRGLPGENRETFRMNYDFLKTVLDKGLLLRRINIRQVRRAPGTPLSAMEGFDAKEEKKLDAVFRRYRELIRNEIDEPLLRKVFPEGTLLRNVIVESHRGDWSIARQIGTYPVALNLPRIYPLLTRLDAFVTGSRERSLVGLAIPFRPLKASLSELKSIPGLSKRAGEFIAKGGTTREDLKISPIFTAIEPFLEE